MSLDDELPITAPTDEAKPRRRMPGQDRRDAAAKNPELRRATPRSPVLELQRRMGLLEALPVAEGAPKTLEDIPERFRKPAKPPGKASVE